MPFQTVENNIPTSRWPHLGCKTFQDTLIWCVLLCALKQAPVGPSQHDGSHSTPIPCHKSSCTVALQHKFIRPKSSNKLHSSLPLSCSVPSQNLGAAFPNGRLQTGNCGSKRRRVVVGPHVLESHSFHHQLQYRRVLSLDQMLCWRCEFSSLQLNGFLQRGA